MAQINSSNDIINQISSLGVDPKRDVENYEKYRLAAEKRLAKQIEQIRSELEQKLINASAKEREKLNAEAIQKEEDARTQMLNDLQAQEKKFFDWRTEAEGELEIALTNLRIDRYKQERTAITNLADLRRKEEKRYQKAIIAFDREQAKERIEDSISESTLRLESETELNHLETAARIRDAEARRKNIEQEYADRLALYKSNQENIISEVELRRRLELQLEKDKIKFREEQKRAEIEAQETAADVERKEQKKTADLKYQRHLEEVKGRTDAARKAYAENAVQFREDFLHVIPAIGDAMSASGKSYAESFVKVLSDSLHKLRDGADKYMGTYAEHMGAIEARLQDSGLTFSKLNKQLRLNTSANPYVQYSNVLERLSTLVEAGITDNVLQRAFLDEVSDKIATTFDATQASLLQIGRLQRADTTASRLGLEANLTRLFNYYFGDTSYLSTQFDGVQETLLDVSSQLSAQSSVELEYIVQKWLGALSSVGASSATISKIAQGISYLGTGNVSALSSNTELQNLLVMASRKAGLDYAGMLSRGISAQETNTLLYNIVKYIQEISQGTSNVVKSQYAQMFGVSLLDMTAFNNLKATMNSLYTAGMTYSDTLDELNYQLEQVSSRTHVSEKINNLLENMMAGVGTSIAENPAAYGLYKAMDMLEKVTGGINLPYISALGSGIDLNMSLEGIAKGGILGFGVGTQLVNAIRSLSSGGGLNLDNWLVESTKGKGFRGYTNAGSVLKTTSGATFVSSTNVEGVTSSVVEQQKESGTTVAGEEESDSKKIMYLLEYIKRILNNEESPLRVDLSSISTMDTIRLDTRDIAQLR